MKSLMDILTIRTQTNNMLLLEVRPNSQIDLIENGFDGDEKLFRLQKENEGGMFQPDKYYTAFKGEELKACGTYHWGGTSTTCASQEWTSQRNKIVAVANKLGFKI